MGQATLGESVEGANDDEERHADASPTPDDQQVAQDAEHSAPTQRATADERDDTEPDLSERRRERKRERGGTMDRATFGKYGPYICGSCGEPSVDCYRCSECGHDLTGDTTTSGRE